MTFIFLILLMTAAISYVIINSKDELTKWAEFFMLCGSVSLAVAWSCSIHPVNPSYLLYNETIGTFLFYVRMYASFINLVGFPYGILMFSIVYFGLICKKIKNIRTFILLKVNWLRTAIIIIPTVISVLMIYYFDKAFVSEVPFFRYVSVFVGFSLFMFIVFAIIDGAFGARLKFEKQHLGSKIRAMTTGASFINHTIKGEIGKINILAERIKIVAAANNQEEIGGYIKTVSDSAEYMVCMVEKMQNQLKGIRLEEHPHFLEQILEDSLMSVIPLIQEKKICVIKNVCYQEQLLCDRIHLQEVFNNLFANAIEAMTSGGRLYISIYTLKKHVVVEIKDTGHGIPKEELPRIIEPFYSTKNPKSNYGLGLSYCYKVIRKHDGTLNINSEPNIGTTITLQFPQKRIISKAYVQYIGANAYGQDQRISS